MEFVSCLQYFIRHILFPALFTSILCLFFFFFLLLHIKFKIVFNSPLGDEELLPALHPLMFYFTLRRSQIQDVSTILRQVNFLYIHSLFFFILHLHLCHVRLLRACWVTYSSSFPSTKITPPPREPPNKRVTSTLSYEFSLLKQKTLCASVLKRPGAMKCLISWDSVRSRLGWQVRRRARGTMISPRRPERRGRLCSHCERDTHTHTNAHTYIFTLFSVAMCSFVFPCRDTENGHSTQEKECSS